MGEINLLNIHIDSKLRKLQKPTLEKPWLEGTRDHTHPKEKKPRPKAGEKLSQAHITVLELPSAKGVILSHAPEPGRKHK